MHSAPPAASALAIADAPGFPLQVISLSAELWNGDVREVGLPGSEGRFGVMVGHTPLLATLREGMLSIYPLAKEPPLHIYVSGGYVEVQPGKVIVMADLALRSADMDQARARAAQQTATSPMAREFTDPDYARLHAELMHQHRLLLKPPHWK